MSVKFAWLAIVTALLPAVAVHVSLILAIRAGVIPACIPYLDGCASISATGRSAPANYVFKPAMMSQWLLLCAYWVGNVVWLRLLGGADQRNATRHNDIAILGCAAAVALVVYVTFLGTQAPFYQFMRRFGIYLYFLLTVIAQIVLARRTIALSIRRQLPAVTRIARFQLGLALAPMLLGVLNLLLKSTLANENAADRAENVIEWAAALMMQAFFLLSYLCWRETRFAARGTIQLAQGAYGDQTSN